MPLFLLKYLAPISVDPIDEDDMGNYEVQRKLRINFVTNNQNIHDEISEAVAVGDMKLAHRLAHTLKGNAGLIGKTELKNAAYEVELLLKDGTDSIWDNKMKMLKRELESVLEELSPLLDESAPQEKSEPMSTKEVLMLFEKLEPMLENINPECVNLLDELRDVPGTEELVHQIENYDFESAVFTLAVLKIKWGGTA
ncbi:MAG: Hpt domain-containing protein [Leptospirales bacterium]|nr:Hpt domain-containing protein [Leptospirales bacterium]